MDSHARSASIFLSSGFVMAWTASSGRPWCDRSWALAEVTAVTSPSVSISLISDAPPIEGAFRMTNQSRCFVIPPLF